MPIVKKCGSAFRAGLVVLSVLGLYEPTRAADKVEEVRIDYA